MNVRYEVNLNNFSKIPGFPFTYWISDKVFNCFTERQLKEILTTRIGLVTGDVDRFLRFWHEVSLYKIQFGEEDVKWKPYQKGGAYRKWYGNNDYVVNWENNGREMIYDNSKDGKVKSHNYNGEYAFLSGITWTKITTGEFGARFVSDGFMFDDAGIMAFTESKNIFYVLAYLDSVAGKYFLKILNNTMNWLPGHIDRLPLRIEQTEDVTNITKDNIKVSKNDWDSFETSWDFKKHPLI